MGNKISLGRYVIYCGFPAKRKKTKEKEEERQRREVELERYEAYLRGETFKANFPEYCRQAGLVVPSKVGVQQSDQTLDVSRRYHTVSERITGILEFLNCLSFFLL